nr:MAG TPA: tegument protein [Caudoviricetes sp.]
MIAKRICCKLHPLSRRREGVFFYAYSRSYAQVNKIN